MSILEEICNDIVVFFNNLKIIFLVDLFELKSIFWSVLFFECLKYFFVMECLKLRKFLLDLKSILKVEEFDFYCEEEWI